MHLSKFGETLFSFVTGLALLTSCKDQASSKLILSPEMVINEVAKGDAVLLIDEQGEGEHLPAERPSTAWSVRVAEGELSWYLPANAVIDLKRKHVITKIYLFDGDGMSGTCRVNYGTPFQWTPLFADSMIHKNRWNEHVVEDITTRFLQISRETDADLREVIVFGYPIEPEVNESTEGKKRKRIPLGQAIGVNTHYLDPLERLGVAGFAREYHNWILNDGAFDKDYPGYPDNAIEWTPVAADAKAKKNIPEWHPDTAHGFSFDEYYRKLKDMGITVFPCIQGTVPWLNGEADKRSRHKPVAKGRNPSDPLSYEAHADFLFQYAARYGSSKVPEEKLKLASNQVKKSGLNYLEYFENWNEPDGWWGGRTDYFTPYEYAAMSSADYDGHESVMGKDKGIKNADPNAKLVMSGIAIPNVDYLRAMEFWFDHHRKDGKFVFDVITVHHYCNEKGSQAVMTKGISPEQDGLRSIMEKITAYRDRNFPQKEVWVTEFGWDTNPVTPQSAGSKERQGQWLVRAYLACFAAGVDRVAMYMLRDVDPNSRIQFSSSGLIGPLGDFGVKPSWYYVHTLRNQLSDLVYEKEIESGSEEVMIYKFGHPAVGKSVYVVWCPTSDGTVVKNYKMKIDQTRSAKATLVSLSDGERNGVPKTLNIRDGMVAVDVSESPVFIHIDD